MMKTITKPRLQRTVRFDVLRTIAVFLVVLCHTFAPPSADLLETPNTYAFALIAMTLGRLGVPFFLFLTGALALPKMITQGESSYFLFLRRQVLPLLVATECWVLIYYFIAIYKGVYEFDVSHLFRIVCFNDAFFWTVQYGHLWYMPMIISIYMILPVVAAILKQFGSKVMLFLTGILAWNNIVMPTIKAGLFPTLMGYTLEGTNLWDISWFGGGVYIIFVVLGYYAVKLPKTSSSLWIAATVSILGFISCVWYQDASIRRIGAFFLWYDNLFLGLTAFSLMVFVCQLPQCRNSKINVLSHVWKQTSLHALAVYFLHLLVIGAIAPYIPTTESLLVNTISLASAAFLISMLIAQVLSCFQPIRKFLFVIKG